MKHLTHLNTSSCSSCVNVIILSQIWDIKVDHMLFAMHMYYVIIAVVFFRASSEKHMVINRDELGEFTLADSGW